MNFLNIRSAGGSAEGLGADGLFSTDPQAWRGMLTRQDRQRPVTASDRRANRIREQPQHTRCYSLVRAKVRESLQFMRLFRELDAPSSSAWRDIIARLTPEIRRLVVAAGRGSGNHLATLRFWDAFGTALEDRDDCVPQLNLTARQR